jgi:hypothetical protein
MSARSLSLLALPLVTVWFGVTSGSSCFAGQPRPVTMTHDLDRLGLRVTLQGSYYGGEIGSPGGYTFVSEYGERTFTFDDRLAGIATSVEGAERFVVERHGDTVASSGTAAFGPFSGYYARGASRGWIGLFDGPRGQVWVTLSTDGPADAEDEAAWRDAMASIATQ